MDWVDLAPDFRWADRSEVFAELPFTLVCALLAKSQTTPSVVMRAAAWQAIQVHLAANKTEAGGLLTGRVCRLPNERILVSVENATPADDFDGTGVSLKMSASVWDDARVRAPSGTFVVGWYHSHPNLGAFFSGTDRSTQRRFFSHEYSLGLVYDPVRGEHLWFSGPDSDQVSNSDTYLV